MMSALADAQTADAQHARAHPRAHGLQCNRTHARHATRCSLCRFVWACLVENVDLAFEVLLPASPLRLPSFRDALYDDWKVWGLQFGLPHRIIPADRPAFEKYMAAELAARTPLHPESAAVLRTLKELGRCVRWSAAAAPHSLVRHSLVPSL